MIKYILPLLLISSPLMAKTYQCDHYVWKDNVIYSQGHVDSFVFISNGVLGYTAGTNGDLELRKILFTFEGDTVVENDGYFSKYFSTYNETKDGVITLLDNCKEIKND